MRVFSILLASSIVVSCSDSLPRAPAETPSESPEQIQWRKAIEEDLKLLDEITHQLETNTAPFDKARKKGKKKQDDYHYPAEQTVYRDARLRGP